MSRKLGASIPSSHDADVRLVHNAFVPRVVLASIDLPDELQAPYHTTPNAGAADPYGTPNLHRDEFDVAQQMAMHRRQSFTAGRRALRAAMHTFAPDVAGGPLLSTPRGAPRLPHGVSGSISHKRSRAIAVAAPADTGTIGIDLEERPNESHLHRPSIARRILTRREFASIADLSPLEQREATLTYFALKEAVYKTIDPYVNRYVRFSEVEIDLQPDGLAVVHLLLPEQLDHLVHIDGYWHVSADTIVALAHAVPR